jgi:hypothetical protein
LFEHVYIHPDEALSITEHSGRTALHLATFNHPCVPFQVAQALLQANRHMVLVPDSQCYTPLHNVCFFPNEALVGLFCDTAIMVEQELQGLGSIPPNYGTSPLFLAAKRAAPLCTLQCLLATRTRTQWIAPSTGGEPYWDQRSLDEYSSPLEILLRDRAAKCFEFILHDTTTIEDVVETNVKEEHGNEANNTNNLNRRRRRAFRDAAYKLLVPPVKEERPIHPPDAIHINTNSNSRNEEEAVPVGKVQDYNVEDILALRLWEKCIVLLAEHCPRVLIPQPRPSSDEDSSGDYFPFGILHAVSSAKVPIPSLLQFVLAIFPEQCLFRDDVMGMIPLHHVLLAQHPYATQSLLRTLLQHTPSSALIPCPKGRTPLCLALDRQLPYHLVVKELLLADSSHGTLGRMDPVSGLYPFCLAATNHYELEVIYELLIANPQVIGYHLSSA